MMIRSTLFSALALTATAAGAQTAPSPAADSAKAFSLDLPPANPASPAQGIDRAAPTIVAFTLDTPIAQLIADPRAKAVLDQDLPGLSDDANLPKFQSLSLRQFQPMTGGQMSTTLLTKVGADLAAIGTAPDVAATPPSIHVTKNRKTDSGR